MGERTTTLVDPALCPSDHVGMSSQAHQHDYAKAATRTVITTRELHAKYILQVSVPRQSFQLLITMALDPHEGLCAAGSLYTHLQHVLFRHAGDLDGRVTEWCD